MRIYSDIATRKTYVERWGASTKHPDSIHCFDDHESSPYVKRGTPWDIYQWLLECAVDVAFPPHLVFNIEHVQLLMRQYVVACDGDLDAWELFKAGI